MTNIKLLMSQIRHGSVDQQLAALNELKSGLQSMINLIDEYEERMSENHDETTTEP